MTTPAHDTWPAEPPAPWVTHLTCPTCRTPEALLAFDGIGTVCTECGDTTRALISDGTEDT
jgi:bacterioferritin-associated ferredoxin